MSGIQKERVFAWRAAALCKGQMSALDAKQKS